MSANIETLVKKHADSYLEPGGNILFTEAIRNALTEQAETHAIELRAYEATVANLEQQVIGCESLHALNRAAMEALAERDERIRQLEAEKVPAEPTADMQAAGAQAIRFDTTTINKLWTANKVYRAMLAAAPAQEKVR